jgi:hypothetical protein
MIFHFGVWGSGEQSKTLMLVHVSPKEMDMAETVCSLSFACRARGTHLGRELSKVCQYILFSCKFVFFQPCFFLHQMDSNNVVNMKGM